LIFHLFSSFIIINSEELLFWSDKRSLTTRWRNSEWNTLWICIVSDSFNLYKKSTKSSMLNKSSILSFSFLNDLAVMMFLSFRNIFELISWLISFLCLLACFIIYSHVLTRVLQVNVNILFMYSDIFLTLMICRCSQVLSYSMKSKSKLIQEWKFLFKKKEIEKIIENMMLLLTNLIMNNYLNQSFCMYEQKKWRYFLMFWFTRSLWSLICEW